MSATRKPRALPLGDELGPTIERFREFVAASQDALFTEGPVHADHELLDVCSEALHLLLTANEMKERHHEVLNCTAWLNGARAEQKLRAEVLELSDRWFKLERQAGQRLRRAQKIRATTPAGIYAKALIVRASVTGAASLAKTLAEDLIACEALRASLWPAAEVA